MHLGMVICQVPFWDQCKLLDRKLSQNDWKIVDWEIEH